MKNDLRKRIIYSLAFLVGCATSIGQKITIDREVSMLALGDSYTIGQSVTLSERWPHQFIDQLGLLGIDADYLSSPFQIMPLQVMAQGMLISARR